MAPVKSFAFIFVAIFDYFIICFSALQIGANEKYVDSGPPFLILLHPALGPLWEVTRQKVNIIYSVIQLPIAISEYLFFSYSYEYGDY